MSNYFESYSFEVQSTNPHKNKTKYTFTGDRDYVQKLRQKPVEIQCTQNYQGWLITSKGYDNGILRIIGEKMIGNRTIKIESVQSNKLPKFSTIQMESDYSPYDPVGDVNANYLEVNDKQNTTNAEFTKIDAQAEQPYQKRFSNSSILSIAEFLHDKEFIKMLPKIGDVE